MKYSCYQKGHLSCLMEFGFEKRTKEKECLWVNDCCASAAGPCIIVAFILHLKARCGVGAEQRHSPFLDARCAVYSPSVWLVVVGCGLDFRFSLGLGFGAATPYQNPINLGIAVSDGSCRKCTDTLKAVESLLLHSRRTPRILVTIVAARHLAFDLHQSSTSSLIAFDVFLPRLRSLTGLQQLISGYVVRQLPSLMH